MISNLSGINLADSIARLSNYLSLYKIEMLIEDRHGTLSSDSSATFSRVKGERLNTGYVSSITREHCRYDMNFNIYDNKFAASLYPRLNQCFKTSIIRLEVAGILSLFRDRRSLVDIQVFQAWSIRNNSFALNSKAQWKFCLVDSKQAQWVDDLMNYLRGFDQGIECFISPMGNTFIYRKVQNRKGGLNI